MVLGFLRRTFRGFEISESLGEGGGMGIGCLNVVALEPIVIVVVATFTNTSPEDPSRSDLCMRIEASEPEIFELRDVVLWAGLLIKRFRSILEEIPKPPLMLPVSLPRPPPLVLLVSEPFAFDL